MGQPCDPTAGNCSCYCLPTKCDLPVGGSITMQVSEFGNFNCTCGQPGFPWACAPWGGSLDYEAVTFNGKIIHTWWWSGQDPYFSTAPLCCVVSGTFPNNVYWCFQRITIYCQNNAMRIRLAHYQSAGDASSNSGTCDFVCDSGIGLISTCPSPAGPCPGADGLNCAGGVPSWGSTSCSPWYLEYRLGSTLYAFTA